MHSLTTVISLLFTATVAVAQNSYYACLTIDDIIAASPPCVQSCQVASLQTDGCPFEDVTCHCLNTGAIGLTLAPCLNASTCDATDIQNFEDYILGVCTYFNGTANDSIPPPSCSTPSHITTTAIETGATTVPCETSSSTVPAPVTISPVTTSPWTAWAPAVSTPWTTYSWASPSPSAPVYNGTSNGSWGSSPVQQFQGSANSQFALSFGLLVGTGIAFAASLI